MTARWSSTIHARPTRPSRQRSSFGGCASRFFAADAYCQRYVPQVFCSLRCGSHHRLFWKRRVGNVPPPPPTSVPPTVAPTATSGPATRRQHLSMANLHRQQLWGHTLAHGARADCTATTQPAPTVPPPTPSAAVSPLLECTVDNGNGTFQAYLGTRTTTSLPSRFRLALTMDSARTQ